MTEWPGVGLIDLDYERQQLVHQVLGAADWIYDEEIGHIPCCTVPIRTLKNGWPIRCGNGPLTGSRLITGNCGEHGDNTEEIRS